MQSPQGGHTNGKHRIEAGDGWLELMGSFLQGLHAGFHLAQHAFMGGDYGHRTLPILPMSPQGKDIRAHVLQPAALPAV